MVYGFGDEESSDACLVMKYAMPTPIAEGAAAIAATAHMPLSEMVWRKKNARATTPNDAAAHDPATATRG